MDNLSKYIEFLKVTLENCNIMSITSYYHGSKINTLTHIRFVGMREQNFRFKFDDAAFEYEIAGDLIEDIVPISDDTQSSQNSESQINSLIVRLSNGEHFDIALSYFQKER